ncbi:osmotically inducible protein OsmC [Psychroserpens burtonensis]|uniref:Osmotically inducible protein OsmC n=1 Tax=Psychroserpens burtonensis TaxID=49278 RepID=A0A5C7B8V6_9FLAO|nr:OsmC family protein [Psychroserpens burtonensis]TXE18548.1 osmotically inducible protein OsmC [Psychroserpens burtonensis]
MFKTQFKVQAKWSAKNALDVSVNGKTHQVFIDDKLPLTVSAAKAFKGDETKYNPEDLLLSALASCHMMSYFYVCAQNGIELIDYKDEAVGVLELKADGSGAFTSVVLNPIVTISKGEMIDKAVSLHKEANILCFIANSCNFLITHNVVVKVTSDK